jgi:hypothetical protein
MMPEAPMVPRSIRMAIITLATGARSDEAIHVSSARRQSTLSYNPANRLAIA